MKTLVKAVNTFQSSDGRNHDNKLQALLAEKTIQMRAIILDANPYAKNGNIGLADAVKILTENADKIAKTARQFNAAINRERTKTDPHKTFRVDGN